MLISYSVLSLVDPGCCSYIISTGIIGFCHIAESQSLNQPTFYLYELLNFDIQDKHFLFKDNFSSLIIFLRKRGELPVLN